MKIIIFFGLLILFSCIENDNNYIEKVEPKSINPKSIKNSDLHKVTLDSIRVNLKYWNTAKDTIVTVKKNSKKKSK